MVSLLALGLAGCASHPAPGPQSAWITVGTAGYAQLRKIAPWATVRESRLVETGGRPGEPAGAEQVRLVEVDAQAVPELKEALHREHRTCGGFMFHSSEEGGRMMLAAPPGPAPTRPSYAIENQARVAPILAQMQDDNIARTILALSAFPNRYYSSASGADASAWLKDEWSSLAKGRADIVVAQYVHAEFRQASVILTIAGSDKAAEAIVLGAHLDSINLMGNRETGKAPGADDDASGVAGLTEVLRSLVAGGYKPRRTITMVAYAAEEVGLRGSQAIAKNFKERNVDVVGVLQLDMVNYKGSDADIYLFTDYTDKLQNDFLANLVKAYLPELTVGYDKCGYACSDHAAWSALGYAASMPFESTLRQDNRAIHSANDTYATSGAQAVHALKFARLAAAYAIELGSAR